MGTHTEWPSAVPDPHTLTRPFQHRCHAILMVCLIAMAVLWHGSLNNCPVQSLNIHPFERLNQIPNALGPRGSDVHGF